MFRNNFHFGRNYCHHIPLVLINIPFRGVHMNIKNIQSMRVKTKATLLSNIKYHLYYSYNVSYNERHTWEALPDQHVLPRPRKNRLRNIATLPRPITIDGDRKSRVTGVPRKNSLRESDMPEWRGWVRGPSISFTRISSASAFLDPWWSALTFHADRPYPSLGRTRAPSWQKGREPRGRSDRLIHYKGAAYRVSSPSTGPSKPTFGPIAKSVFALIPLPPRLFGGRTSSPA